MHGFFDRSQQPGPDASRTWLALMGSALEDAGHSEETRAAWRASLQLFLDEVGDPARVLSWELRDYFYGKTELGSEANDRSLPVAQSALEFFYEHVLPRPALARIAQDPFLPIDEGPTPDWMDTRLTALTQPWKYAPRHRRPRKASTGYLLRNAFEAADASSAAGSSSKADTPSALDWTPMRAG